VIFVHQNLISNRLTYLVHAKSTGELISFGFSDCSVDDAMRNIVNKPLLQLINAVFRFLGGRSVHEKLTTATTTKTITLEK